MSSLDKMRTAGSRANKMHSSHRPSRSSLTVDGVDYDVSNLFVSQSKQDIADKNEVGFRKNNDYERTNNKLLSSPYNNLKSYQKSMSSRTLISPFRPDDRFCLERSTSMQPMCSEPTCRMHSMYKKSEPKKNQKYGLKKPPPQPPTDQYPQSQKKENHHSNPVPAFPRHVATKKPLQHHHRLPSYCSSQNGASSRPSLSPTMSESNLLPSRPKEVNIEISPGNYAPLRGSFETTIAIQRGEIASVRCLCCNQYVSCINNAAYFICPTCRVINSVPGGLWGVGLGFRM